MIFYSRFTTIEDLNELSFTEVRDEVENHEEKYSEKYNEKSNENNNNIYDYKKCNSKVSIINKGFLCNTCVKEKQIYKERVEAFKGKRKLQKK